MKNATLAAAHMIAPLLLLPLVLLVVALEMVFVAAVLAAVSFYDWVRLVVGMLMAGAFGLAPVAAFAQQNNVGGIAAKAYVQSSTPGGIAAAGGDLAPTVALGGLVGDSRNAQSYQFTGTGAVNLAVPANSPVGWATYYLRQRIHFSHTYNKAVSGSMISAIPAQMDALLALSPRPTYIVALTGTNSFADGGLNGQQAWDQVREYFIVRARNAGITPVLILDLPRQVDSTYTTTKLKYSMQYNQLARNLGPSYGALIVDPTGYLADAASSDGAPRSGYYYDPSSKIHPATRAAERTGYALAQGLDSRLPNVSLPGFVNRADTYDATNNPYGNILTNGLFTGTGGSNTSSAGTASGSVADSWNNRTLSGTGTSVASLIARDPDSGGTPGYWQQVVWDSPSGVSTYRFSQTVSPVVGTNYPAGCNMVLEMDVDVSGATGLESLDIRVQDLTGGTGNAASYFFGPALIGATYFPYPNFSGGRIRTVPMTLSAGNDNVTVRFEGRVNTGSATIKFGNAELRCLPAGAPQAANDNFGELPDRRLAA